MAPRKDKIFGRTKEGWKIFNQKQLIDIYEYYRHPDGYQAKAGWNKTKLIDDIWNIYWSRDEGGRWEANENVSRTGLSGKDYLVWDENRKIQQRQEAITRKAELEAAAKLALEKAEAEAREKAEQDKVDADREWEEELAERRRIKAEKEKRLREEEERRLKKAEEKRKKQEEKKKQEEERVKKAEEEERVRKAEEEERVRKAEEEERVKEENKKQEEEELVRKQLAEGKEGQQESTSPKQTTGASGLVASGPKTNPPVTNSEQQTTKEKPLVPVPPASSQSGSRIITVPPNTASNPKVISNLGRVKDCSGVTPAQVVPIDKRPNISTPENEALLKTRIQDTINAFSYRGLELQEGKAKPVGFRPSTRYAVIKDDGSQISWEEVDNSPQSTQWRGNGPLWTGNSSAVDSCIVAGMFLDTGAVLADLPGKNYKLPSILESFGRTVREPRWDRDGITRRDQFWKELAKSHEKTSKPLTFGTSLPAIDVWRACTSGFGQFPFRYQTKSDCLTCSKTHLTNGRLATLLSLSTPEGGERRKLEESLKLLFRGQDINKECNACGHTGMTHERIILSGDLPIRLVVSPPGDGLGVSRHTATVKFEYQTGSGKSTATYRWIGGIYPQDDHFRVFWSQRGTFDAETGQIFAYDGKCASGAIIGMASNNLDEQVPYPWGKKGKAVLFYQREYAPPSEVWTLGSALTVPGGTQSTKRAARIANLDPKDEADARKGIYRPRHHPGFDLDVKLEAIEDPVQRRNVEILKFDCPLSSVRDCYLAMLVHPTDMTAALRTLREGRVQLDEQNQDISLYQIASGLWRAQTVRAVVTSFPWLATYRMANDCYADLLQGGQFKDRDMLFEAVKVKMVLLKLPGADARAVAELIPIIDRERKSPLNAKNFEELLDKIMVSLVGQELPDLGNDFIQRLFGEQSQAPLFKNKKSQDKFCELSAMALKKHLIRQLPDAHQAIEKSWNAVEKEEGFHALSIHAKHMEVLRMVLLTKAVTQIPDASNDLIYEKLDALLLQEGFLSLTLKKKLPSLFKAIKVEQVRRVLAEADAGYIGLVFDELQRAQGAVMEQELVGAVMEQELVGAVLLAKRAKLSGPDTKLIQSVNNNLKQQQRLGKGTPGQRLSNAVALARKEAEISDRGRNEKRKSPDKAEGGAEEHPDRRWIDELQELQRKRPRLTHDQNGNEQAGDDKSGAEANKGTESTRRTSPRNSPRNSPKASPRGASPTNSPITKSPKATPRTISPSKTASSRSPRTPFTRKSPPRSCPQS